MAVIDIGSPVIDRGSWYTYGLSCICKENPANASGKITSVDILMKTLGNVKVGIFYREDPTGYPNRFTARDTQNIGSIDGHQIVDVDLDVEEGDFIGFWIWASGLIEADGSGGEGVWTRVGDIYTWENEEFFFQSGWTISIGAAGHTIPTVTTQEVSDILSITATGNGNITDTGGVNCTKRGICYNLTGNPTVADSKIEETGDFGIGSFTENLTELSSGTKYYVKAYAYNTAGYGYGNEENFTTDEAFPIVTTVNASCEDRQSTTLTAVGILGSGCTYRGFEYYQKNTGVAYDSSMYAVREIGTFVTTGEYRMTLYGLKPLTCYWIRAYAGNVFGIVYGDWVLCCTTEVPSYDIYTEENTARYRLYVSDDEAIAWRGYKGPYSGKQTLINISDITNKTKGVKVLKIDLPDANTKGNFHVCITVKQELKS